MVSHLSDPLTIDQLSARFRISPTALKDIFRQTYGRPIHQYLLEKRVQHAAELLHRSSLSIVDIAAAVGAAKRPGQVLVGFAAETEKLLQNAHRKLESKHLDLIVLNDVSQPGAGFNVDTNIATLITPDSQTEYPLRTKKQLAEDILDAVLDIRKQKKA